MLKRLPETVPEVLLVLVSILFFLKNQSMTKYQHYIEVVGEVPSTSCVPSGYVWCPSILRQILFSGLLFLRMLLAIIIFMIDHIIWAVYWYINN